MRLNDRTQSLLLGFLLVSLLLHLLLLYLLPRRGLFPESPPPEKPVVVEVRPPRPAEPRERELDLPPLPDQPRETPAKRLGPSDQVAEKETAPEGDAPEERRPDAPAPQVARPEPSQVSPAPPQQRTEPRAAVQPREEASPETRPERRPAETGSRPAPAEKPSAAETPPAPPREMPDLKSLLQLPETTVARLESEWRRKYRKDVETGDAVWLDTERDILISFFQRFRNNIYAVWNYPARAREQGREGTALLRVTVNRDGTLAEVQVMESSGSAILDDEAMAAVRKGAPFGKLPEAYEEDQLNIFAFFSYNLTRRVIY